MLVFISTTIIKKYKVSSDLANKIKDILLKSGKFKINEESKFWEVV